MLDLAQNLENPSRIDIASTTVIYKGFIESPYDNADTSLPKFKIAKVSKSGNQWITQWAVGAYYAYNQIWDNRASLTYI